MQIINTLKEIDMSVKRFDKIYGEEIKLIEGQMKFGYSLLGLSQEFCDMPVISKYYRHLGTALLFYDFERGKVYTVFEKIPNVEYAKPIYYDGYFYILEGDFNKNIITLYKYHLEKTLESIEKFPVSDLNLVNLTLIGNKVYMLSQEGKECNFYYPEKIKISLEHTDRVVLVDNDKIYIDRFVEEDWDEENYCAGENYKFYHKVLIKDFEDNIVSEETGYLSQDYYGNWRIG